MIIAEGRVLLAGSPDEVHRRTGLDSLEEIMLSATVGREAAE